MKPTLLAIFLLFAASLQAQMTWKEKKAELKKIEAIADTMQFPNPFEYKYIDSVPLSKNAIYNKCYQWISVITSNAMRGLQIHDSLSGKLVMTNVESGMYDATETLTIDIKDGKYRLSIDNYIHTDYNGHSEFVSSMKDTKSLRTDKYFIVLHNEAAFKSLSDFVRKKDDF